MVMEPRGRAYFALFIEIGARAIDALSAESTWWIDPLIVIKQRLNLAKKGG